jgi:hypothetical protein
MLHRSLLLASLAILIPACGSDKAPPPPADKPKPADKPADKPPDKPADKPASKSAEPAWEKYTSKEGAFSIDFPSKPREQKQGAIAMAMSEFGTTGSDTRTAVCGVTFLAKPAGGDAKTMLDASMARHKESAKIIEEKDLKLGKHTGRLLVVENSSHRKWIRVYITDKNIYVLNCGGPFDRAASDGPIATKTLDSFALAK